MVAFVYCTQSFLQTVCCYCFSWQLQLQSAHQLHYVNSTVAETFSYSLALCNAPTVDSSAFSSLSIQHDQIIPPEHKSIGLPPFSTQDIERPHSNLYPWYRQLWGITERRWNVSLNFIGIIIEYKSNVSFFKGFRVLFVPNKLD